MRALLGAYDPELQSRPGLSPIPSSIPLPSHSPAPGRGVVSTPAPLPVVITPAVVARRPVSAGAATVPRPPMLPLTWERSGAGGGTIGGVGVGVGMEGRSTQPNGECDEGTRRKEAVEAARRTKWENCRSCLPGDRGPPSSPSLLYAWFYIAVLG